MSILIDSSSETSVRDRGIETAMFRSGRVRPQASVRCTVDFFPFPTNYFAWLFGDKRTCARVRRLSVDRIVREQRDKGKTKRKRRRRCQERLKRLAENRRAKRQKERRKKVERDGGESEKGNGFAVRESEWTVPPGMFF